jgi:hypothetical protein
MDDLRVNTLIYKLDFIDLKILEHIISYEFNITFQTLYKKLKKVNIWDDGIIRRRLKRLRTYKLIHFEDGQRPMIIEAYQHNTKNIQTMKVLLENRLQR